MRETKRSIKQLTGENAVQMRVHRRSLEQKSNRAKIYCKGRQGLDDEASLDPVLEEDEVPQKPVTAKDTRQEMLQRWKEEKKLKAKLQSEKSGKPFKVTKINHAQPVFLFSEKQVNGQPITAAAVNAMNASMIVTRSRMNLSIQPKAQPEKRVLPSRAVNSTKTQPALQGPAKKVSKKTNGTGKPSAPKPQPVKTVASQPSHPVIEAPKVKREPSFAPLQFVFTAPTGLSPFFLEPSNSDYVEKFLPPLTFHSSVLPLESCNKLANKSTSDAKEQSTPISKAEPEHVFKTPHGIGNDLTFKISPLLENNSNICMTRGRPPSSKKKSTPRRSRISGSHKPLEALQFDIQHDGTTQHCPAECVSEMKLMETNVSCSVDEPKMTTPTRQLHDRTPAKSTDEMGSRVSSGMVLSTSYFRKMLEDTTGELKNLCGVWQLNMETEKMQLSESITGKIRTTIGQSELLMSERFKQFSGLIDDCEFKRGEKITTCVDLQGFWEMIYFQVEDVKAKFERLEIIKNSNWEDFATPLKKPKAIVKRTMHKGPKPQTRANSGAAAQAARQRLADAKAKAAQLRKALANGSPEVHVPKMDVEPVGIVFAERKIATPKRRRSLNFQPTADEATALLLPVPVLDSLSLNSPVVSQNPGKRLSELYSPLRMGRKSTFKALETIKDNENSEMVDVTATLIPKKSIATPRRRSTRSSNLIRFSAVFANPADDARMEKENADLVLY